MEDEWAIYMPTLEKLKGIHVSIYGLDSTGSGPVAMAEASKCGEAP
jgi:hypothetical protein